MYSDSYSEEIFKKLVKLKKKDSQHYTKVRKKIDEILENPKHTYEFLHHEMKGINRVHIGHFVLIFIINHEDKTIVFEDYNHHNKIYE